MGIYDRHYSQDEYGSGRQVYPMRPSLPPGVKWLLIINIAVFVACMLVRPVADYVYGWCSVYPADWRLIAQVWRLITYQFLHDLGGIGHIFFNMLMLYFFGPLMEQLWGTRRFVKFFLTAGAAGGVVYSILAATGILEAKPMVGASGGLYGILGAVAILFPQMRVYIFGVVPMSMRAMAIMTVIISLLFFATGNNAGGEAAHLTGIAVGVAYVLYQPWLTTLRMKRSKGRWSQKIEDERSFQMEVDRILEKIHNTGIASLTAREKETLREATRREQQMR